jgi:predicted cupin superfamily sugar epimerase
MTAIYYLVTPASYSLLHRLTCDELYHFYAGDPIELVEVTLGGDVTRTILGPPMFPQAVAQHVVPAGHWQGSRPVLGGAWGLVGTTCSPGFEFADFELARPDDPAWTDPSLAPFLHR